MKQSPRTRVPAPALTGQHDLSIEPRLSNNVRTCRDGCASLSGEPWSNDSAVPSGCGRRDALDRLVGRGVEHTHAAGFLEVMRLKP